MSPRNSRKAGFRWKTASLFLLFLMGSILALDIYKQGSFEATNTGKFLRDKGITAFVEKTWISTKSYFIKAHEYLETTYPESYKTVVEFSTPYVKLTRDIYLIVKNLLIKICGNISSYISTTIPTVVAKIEYHVPGLLDSIQQISLKGVQTMKTYSVLIAEQAIENSVKSIRWLKTNVFVGNLSPESLQNYGNQAVSTINDLASQTYDWVYEKVQTLSKVE